MDRLKSLAKNVIELNLRSVSTLLGLSKDYVKALDSIIRHDIGPNDPPNDQGQNPNSTPEPRRPPILLVGSLGEVASGAFALNNSSTAPLQVTFAVQGAVSSDQVRLTPSTLDLEPGKEAIIRIQAPITEKFVEGKDYFGVVHVPSLSKQVVDFVIRRIAHADQVPQNSSSNNKPAAPVKKSTNGMN